MATPSFAAVAYEVLTLANAAGRTVLPLDQQHGIIQSSDPSCSLNSDLSVFCIILR